MKKIECKGAGDNDGFFEHVAKASPIEPVVILPLLLVNAIDKLLCEVNANGAGGDGSLANRSARLSMDINLERQKAR